MEVSMTDEEQQQAAAYIKLQDNVDELIRSKVDIALLQWTQDGIFEELIVDVVKNSLRNNPRGVIASAITNHIRLLNTENIK
jgi:hypothetical protein